MKEVPEKVLKDGGVVPVSYVTKGKKAGVETLSKKDLKAAAKKAKKKK